MKSASAALFYVSNILYWHEVTNYFNPVSDTDIYLHTWSLAVEEQFYLVWPALMLVTFRKKAPLWMIMGLIGLGSFAACVLFSYRDEPAAFFLAPFRAWEFAVGALAGLATIRRWASAASFIGILMIAAGVTALSNKSVYPGYLVAIPVAGTALLLMSGTSDHPVSRLLRSFPAVKVGHYSYSWYLWHWPVLILGQELIGNGVVDRLFLAALSLGLAATTFKLVENPIRTNQRLVQRPIFSLAAIGSASVVATGIVGAVWLQARAQSLSPRYRQFTIAMNDKTELPGCMTDFGDSKLRVCSFGAGQRTVALFGDSHAAMFFPALEGVRVVTFLKSSCPAADVDAFNHRLNRVESECARWRQRALQGINALHPDAVVLTSAAVHVRNPDQWRQGYRRTLAALAPIPTVLIDATPFFGFSVPDCLARGRLCRVPRSKAIDARVIAAEKAAASGFPNVRVVDFTDELCGRATCDPMKVGAVVYADGNHITSSYAKRFRSQLPLPK